MVRLKARDIQPVGATSHSIDLLWEGDTFFDTLIHDIDAARNSIFLESYIFHQDHTGEAIIQALLGAASRGLQIRILVDGVGSFPIRQLRRAFHASAVVFRVFKPVSIFTVFRTGFHRRNHRKLILLDNRIAYTGGMNIVDQLSFRQQGERRWRDSMIRVEGGPVGFLQSSFEQIWKFSSGPSFGLLPGMKLSQSEIEIMNPMGKSCPDVLFLSNLGHQLRRAQRRFMIRLIQKARHRIYIGSAYFVPGPRILWLLRRKAKSGVDVRIITAGRSDVWLARQAGRSTYHRLLKAGVRIMEFSERMYHSKMNIVDDRFMIGSTNMDYRSFLHNLEVDAWICRSDSLREALLRWELDEDGAREIHLESWQRRGITEKLLEKIAFLLRFYL